MPSGSEFRPSHMQFDLTKYDQDRYEVGRVGILKSLIPSGHGRTAIDIGCGPGYFTRELSGKGYQTTAVDTGIENLERAKRYADDTRLGDATSVLLQNSDSHYDLALCLELIEHMPRAQGGALLMQIWRVLKPGGTLILSTPNRLSLEGLIGYYWGEKIRGWGKWMAWESTHVHVYTSSEILRLLRQTGFSMNSVTGYHYGGLLPKIGHWNPPIAKSTIFPVNRLGFNIIIECQKTVG